MSRLAKLTVGVLRPAHSALNKCGSLVENRHESPIVRGGMSFSCSLDQITRLLVPTS